MLFEQNIFHSSDFNDKGFMECRNAVRAVIVKNNKILLVYSKKNDEYKFPGGGVKSNETPNEALIREIREEIGATVLNIQEKIGTITEYSRTTDNDKGYFKMISDYYLVDVQDNMHQQNLDEYEKDLLFTPRWIDIEEAESTNRSNMVKNKEKVTKWIKRETYVLQQLMATF